MRLGHSESYLGITGLLLALLVALGIHARLASRGAAGELEEMRRQVATLELTDLSLFSEASYTRNLSLADRFTAFQDSPMAFEHFPSGALVGPPAQLRRP